MNQMIKGILEDYRAIETYLDSQNSFGAMIRTGIRIEIDDDFNYLGLKFKSPGMFSVWISAL